MNKRKNILKQLFAFKEKQEDNPIDKKIEELKQELTKLSNGYAYNVYLILKQIVELRQKQIKGYTFSKLSYENGINLSPDKVQYIFGYRFASPNSLKLVEEGKINASLVLYLIRRGEIFRNYQRQDKVINAIVERKVTISQVSNIAPKSILLKVENGNTTRGNDEFQIRMLQKVGKLDKEFKECKDMFDDDRMKDRLKLRVNELNKFVQEL